MEVKEHNNIESIWKAYHDQLLRFILKRVSDKATAEDILQNVFIKILSNIDSLKDSTKMKSWLFQITRNAIIDHYRQSNASGNIPLLFQEENDELNGNVTEEVGKWISPFISSLPEKYKEALILSELNGMSQKEMATHLGISYVAARARVQRGRKMLKEKLTQCCIFHTDKYGNIMDYRAKKNDDDNCNSCDN